MMVELPSLLFSLSLTSTKSGFIPWETYPLVKANRMNDWMIEEVFDIEAQNVLGRSTSLNISRRVYSRPHVFSAGRSVPKSPPLTALFSSWQKLLRAMFSSTFLKLLQIHSIWRRRSDESLLRYSLVEVLTHRTSDNTKHLRMYHQMKPLWQASVAALLHSESFMCIL